jgi:hypothetical protein
VTPPKTHSCENFLRKTQEKKEILRNPVRNGFLDPKNKFLKTGICNLGEDRRQVEDDEDYDNDDDDDGGGKLGGGYGGGDGGGGKRKKGF